MYINAPDQLDRQMNLNVLFVFICLKMMTAVDITSDLVQHKVNLLLVKDNFCQQYKVFFTYVQWKHTE